MSDYCSGCRFDPAQRTGADACPFTTLYWRFLDRHRRRLAANPRMGRQLAALRRLSDIAAVRVRAEEVTRRLFAGQL